MGNDVKQKLVEVDDEARNVHRVRRIHRPLTFKVHKYVLQAISIESHVCVFDSFEFMSITDRHHFQESTSGDFHKLFAEGRATNNQLNKVVSNKK